MREPNSRLGQARERKEAFLPEIARLSLEGHTSREVAEKVGIPKTTVLRWRNSLRRDCASRSVKETMEMIDKLNERYDTIYRKALEGLDRSQPDEEIRTVTDCAGDDSKKKRSVRTKTQAGNPAWLTRAQAALDATAKLLKEMGMPAEAESPAADSLPTQGEVWTEDDLARLYVDAILDHIVLDQLVRKTLLFCEQKKPDFVGIEAEQFQELLVHELVRQCGEEYALRWSIWKMMSRGYSKLARIRRLSQYVLNRELRFKADSPGCRLLVDQLMDFPLGDHDDGPDALEICIRLPLEMEEG